MDLQVEGMLGTFWAAQSCPRPLRDVQGFSGLLRNVQGSSRLLRDVQGCLEVFKAAQSCAWGCHSFLQISELKWFWGCCSSYPAIGRAWNPFQVCPGLSRTQGSIRASPTDNSQKNQQFLSLPNCASHLGMGGHLPSLHHRLLNYHFADLTSLGWFLSSPP